MNADYLFEEVTTGYLEENFKIGLLSENTNLSHHPWWFLSHVFVQTTLELHMIQILVDPTGAIFHSWPLSRILPVANGRKLLLWGPSRTTFYQQTCNHTPNWHWIVITLFSTSSSNPCRLPWPSKVDTTLTACKMVINRSKNESFTYLNLLPTES